MPASDYGKGGDTRPLSITRDEWGENWDQIFKKTKKKTKARALVPPRVRTEKNDKKIDKSD
jgi:hypothetical protein